MQISFLQAMYCHANSIKDHTWIHIIKTQRSVHTLHLFPVVIVHEPTGISHPFSLPENEGKSILDRGMSVLLTPNIDPLPSK